MTTTRRTPVAQTRIECGTTSPRSPEIAPLLIVEELYLDDEGSVPADIKVHCFDRGRLARHTRDHYDEHWRRIELTFTPGSGYDPFIPEAVDRDWGDRFTVPSSNP